MWDCVGRLRPAAVEGSTRKASVWNEAGERLNKRLRKKSVACVYLLREERLVTKQTLSVGAFFDQINAVVPRKHNPLRRNCMVHQAIHCYIGGR